MACDIKIELNYYNTLTETYKTESLPVGKVEANVDPTLEEIADFIINLPYKTRSELADKLLSAQSQTLKESDITKKNSLVSNITLDEIKRKYPYLNDLYYNLEFDTDDNFIIIDCYDMKINGSTYFGRVLDYLGNEVFIINNRFGAELLFAYLEARTKIKKVLSKDSDLFVNLYQKYGNLIDILETKYSLSIQNILNDYLNNKSHYKIFKTSTNETINPQRILSNLMYDITGNYDSDTRKSDLRLALESIKTIGKDKYDWVLNDKKLYSVLKDFDLIDISYDQFLSMSEQELDNLLKEVFKSDPKLIRAKVTRIDGGVTTILEETNKVVNITQEQLKNAWRLFKEKHKDIKYPPFSKITEANNINFLKQALEEIYSFDKLNIQLVDNKIKATYIQEKSTVEKTSSRKITLSFPWASIGSLYDFSYDTKYLFSPVSVEEVDPSESVINGEYQGGYIYEYFDEKSKTTHYAVSRHIISPDSYMSTYSSLLDAKLKIKLWNKTLKINENGLWSLKLNSTGGIKPRTSKLEATGITSGQIITVRNFELPNVDFKNMPDIFKDLFNGTVDNFHNKTKDWNITGLDKLKSPDTIASFLIKGYKILTENRNKIPVNQIDLLDLIQHNKSNLEQLVISILESPLISYRIENIGNDEKGNKYGTLKFLQNNGNNIDISGKIGKDSLTISDMERAIKYFNGIFNTQIKTLTRSELEELNKSENLGLDGKIDTVRAFVYNGNIYINSSNADLSDLFHEMSHIFLGLLKTKYPDSYNEIIQKYIEKKGFKKTYSYINMKYKNFSEQDRIEEAVVNMIANEMFHKDYLVHLFSKELFIEDFKKIFELDSILQSTLQTSLGFNGFIEQLTHSKNLNLMQRNMKITQLVKKLISDKKIQEINCHGV